MTQTKFDKLFAFTKSGSINNNPVIIYMTAKFVEPKNWSNNAHSNLHVQLLTGYNKITGDQIIVDPWKYKTLSSYWSLNKNKA